jgi:hypothetical protein
LKLMFSTSPDAVRFIAGLLKRSMIPTPADMTGTPDKARAPPREHRLSFPKLSHARGHSD